MLNPPCNYTANRKACCYHSILYKRDAFQSEINFMNTSDFIPAGKFLSSNVPLCWFHEIFSDLILKILCCCVPAQGTVHFIKMNFEFKLKRVYPTNIINNMTEKYNMDHKQRGIIIYKDRVCISLTTVNVIEINYL